MKEDEIAELMRKRQPIWEALSTLYLDQDLQEDDYQRIILQIWNKGFTLTELKEIDLYEVFPTLYRNLLSSTGVWNGFKQAWLYDECRKNHERRRDAGFRMVTSIKNMTWPWMRKKPWVEIEKRWPETLAYKTIDLNRRVSEEE